MEEITGVLTSGLNRGAKFLALPVYCEIFSRELGSEPFRGTLNLIISPESVEKVNKRFVSGKKFDNLMNEGSPVGSIILIPIILVKGDLKMNSVVVRPLLTTHQSEVIEVVSTICFRDQWKIKDGDELTIKLLD